MTSSSMSARATWHHKYTLTGQFRSRLPPQKAFFLMVADIGIFMSIIIGIYYILGKLVLQPIKRGFYCNDPYINNPLFANTVPTSYLLLITLASPFFVVFGSLLLKHSGGNLAAIIKNVGKLTSMVCRETAFVYLDYVLAFGVLTIALEFMKCTSGRLRPNFLNMCRPDLTVCEKDPGAFIEDYTCNPLLPKHARNSRMSFPSGHAAAAVLAQLFVYFYLRHVFDNANAETRNNQVVKMFKRSCLLFFSVFAILCSMSRIWDYWHFPSDVLGGVLTALVFFYATLRKYSRTQRMMDEGQSIQQQ